MGRGGNIIQGPGWGVKLTLVHSRPPQSVEAGIGNAPSGCSNYSNKSTSARLPETKNVGPIGRPLSEFTGSAFDGWLDDNTELLVRRAAHLAGHRIESDAHLRIFWEAWGRGRLNPLADQSSVEPFEHEALLAERFSYLAQALESPNPEIGFKSLQQISLFFDEDVVLERFTSDVVQSIRITAEEFISTSYGRGERIRAALALQRMITVIPEVDRDTVMLRIIGVLSNAVAMEHTAVNLSALQALDTIVQKVSEIPATFSVDIERMPEVLKRVSVHGETEEIRRLAESICRHIRDRFIPLSQPIPPPQTLLG